MFYLLKGDYNWKQKQLVYQSRLGVRCVPSYINMVVSQNKRTPTSNYYNPYYRDPQNGTLYFENPTHEDQCKHLIQGNLGLQVITIILTTAFCQVQMCHGVFAGQLALPCSLPSQGSCIPCDVCIYTHIYMYIHLSLSLSLHLSVAAFEFFSQPRSIKLLLGGTTQGAQKAG